MWRFWGLVLLRIPRLAWHTTAHAEAICSLLLFVLLVINPPLSEDAPHWIAQHPIYVRCALALVFIHLVMRSVYELHLQIQVERGAATQKCTELQDSLKNVQSCQRGEVESQKAIEILVRLKGDLATEIRARKSLRPSCGRADTLPLEQKKHDEESRTAILKILSVAESQCDYVRKMDKERIRNAGNFLELWSAVEQQVDVIDKLITRI